MNIYSILLLLLLIITVLVVSWLNWRMVRHTTVILLTVIIGWTLTSVTSYVPHGLVNTYHYTVQAHLSAGQHACVCLLSGWAKNDFFLPAAVTRCTVMFNVKFDKFQLKTELWDFSPQNCQNMHFCQKKCAPGVNRLHEFYEIFSIYRQTTELWAFLMEEFSHKFAVVPRAKLLIRSEKLGGARAKIGQTFSITVTSFVGSYDAQWLWTKQCDAFFVCFSRFNLQSFFCHF